MDRKLHEYLRVLSNIDNTRGDIIAIVAYESIYERGKIA